MNEDIPFFNPEDPKNHSPEKKKGGSSQSPISFSEEFGVEEGYIHFTMSVREPFFSFKKTVTVSGKQSKITDVIGYLPSGTKFILTFFGTKMAERIVDIIM